MAQPPCCDICHNDFEWDPSSFHNEDSCIPCQSSICGHSICKTCITRMQLSAAKDGRILQKHMKCPICKEPKAYNAESPHTNRLACDLGEQLAVKREIISFLKREPRNEPETIDLTHVDEDVDDEVDNEDNEEEEQDRKPSPTNGKQNEATMASSCNERATLFGFDISKAKNTRIQNCIPNSNVEEVAKIRAVVQGRKSPQIATRQSTRATAFVPQPRPGQVAHCNNSPDSDSDLSDGFQALDSRRRRYTNEGVSKECVMENVDRGSRQRADQGSRVLEVESIEGGRGGELRMVQTTNYLLFNEAMDRPQGSQTGGPNIAKRPPRKWRQGTDLGSKVLEVESVACPRVRLRGVGTIEETFDEGVSPTVNLHSNTMQELPAPLSGQYEKKQQRTTTAYCKYDDNECDHNGDVYDTAGDTDADDDDYVDEDVKYPQYRLSSPRNKEPRSSKSTAKRPRHQRDSKPRPVIQAIPTEKNLGDHKVVYHDGDVDSDDEFQPPNNIEADIMRTNSSTAKRAKRQPRLPQVSTATTLAPLTRKLDSKAHIPNTQVVTPDQNDGAYTQKVDVDNDEQNLKNKKTEYQSPNKNNSDSSVTDSPKPKKNRNQKGLQLTQETISAFVTSAKCTNEDTEGCKIARKMGLPETACGEGIAGLKHAREQSPLPTDCTSFQDVIHLMDFLFGFGPKQYSHYSILWSRDVRKGQKLRQFLRSLKVKKKKSDLEELAVGWHKHLGSWVPPTKQLLVALIQVIEGHYQREKERLHSREVTSG